MTWIKRLIYGLAVFFGLYLFGNFRINDVNVRDYLHSVVTPDQLKSVGQKVMAAGEFLYGRLHLILNGTEPPKDDMISTQTAAKMVDEISAEDKEKMLKILKQHVNDESDPAAPHSDEDLKKVIDQITKGSQ